jgi:hypothetical protein
MYSRLALRRAGAIRAAPHEGCGFPRTSDYPLGTWESRSSTWAACGWRDEAHAEDSRAIAVAAKDAGLHVTLPTCDVAGKAISSGADAKCFASYMRIHALEGTGGKTYSQMPRYASADGLGTADEAKAVKDVATGKPQSNPARQVWISETAWARRSTRRSSPRRSRGSRSSWARPRCSRASASSSCARDCSAGYAPSSSPWSSA